MFSSTFVRWVSNIGFSPREDSLALVSEMTRDSFEVRISKVLFPFSRLSVILSLAPVQSPESFYMGPLTFLSYYVGSPVLFYSVIRPPFHGERLLRYLSTFDVRRAYERCGL